MLELPGHTVLTRNVCVWWVTVIPPRALMLL